MNPLLSFRFFRYLLFEAIPYILLTLTVLTLLILAQQISRQADLLFNSTATLLLSTRIILYLLPGILIITLPFSLLIGSLIALNRISSDNEIIAARASGISMLKIACPLILCGIAGSILSAFLTIRTIPKLIITAKDLRAELLLTLLSTPIKAQTFNTQFANHLVYTREIDKVTGEWIGVFILRQVAAEQSIVLTAERGRLRLTQSSPLALEIELNEGLLLTSSTLAPEKQTLTSFQQQKIKLSAETPSLAQAIERTRTAQELSLTQLSTQGKTAASTQERRQAQVEWHKRFALPLACLILTALAIPLGLLSARQAGRAVAFSVGFIIAVLYYLTLIGGQNLALAGTLPAWLGIWLPNLIWGGIAFLQSFSRSSGSRPVPVTLRLTNPFKKLLNNTSSHGRLLIWRRPLLLSLVNYLLTSEFLKYFLLAITILVSTSIIFTLFDLLPALNRSGLGWKFAGTYLLFLVPQILYYITPFAFLLAALATHGILSRSNQLTALLTTGQSSFRLLSPLLLCLLATIAGLLWLSENILPYANREQDARYNQMKGKKSEQAVLALGRHWVQGEDEVIYGFQINITDNSLLNTSAYRINPQSGKLLELVQAQKAHPLDTQTWHIQQGWRYTIDAQTQLHFQPLPTAIPDSPDNHLLIREGTSLFRRIVNEAAKMSFQELRTHIRYLSKIGAATSPLRVELEKKLAFPFSCFPLLMLALPLTLKNTRRGTLSGIGLSLMVGFTYWITANFIEGLGKQSYLPPGLSVWGTQALFLALGIFLLFRLKK
jgi:LPS export ABC transporter permease LptG/LPS export ABC transporter permease LptF